MAFAESSILVGDMRERLHEMPEASVDSCVTDPPYHLTSIVKRFGTEDAAPAKSGKTGVYARSSKGFMGKTWDGGDIAFQPETWAAVLRVLKPGAHLLAFAAAKNAHRMFCAVEDAGFEIRDCIMWLYGSGFPKSHNLDGEWKGWGSALKPAYEPILVARKPLEGTIAHNVEKYGVGAINIDECRVEDGTETGAEKPHYEANYGNAVFGKGMGGGDWENTKGRWPANVIHDGLDQEWARFFYCAKASKSDRNEGTDDLPKKQGGMVSDTSGHLARRDGYEPPKVGNHHPTVKPTDLMRYLCRLVTPPGGLVLDPFAGSGSTGKAAALEGFRFVGVELDPDYAAIAQHRVWHAQGMDWLA